MARLHVRFGGLLSPAHETDLDSRANHRSRRIIHILDDTVDEVSEPAPAIAPLFRSDQQFRILGALFTSTDELSIGALANRAGVAQATVSREIARLEDHGLVVTRTIGRTKLASPNWALRWAPELRTILTQTVGVLAHLGNELSRVDHIDEALVYGPWAARYTGDPGPPPDVAHVVAIGDASPTDVQFACIEARRDLWIRIESVVVDSERWNAHEPDADVAEIRAGRLVPIALHRRPVEDDSMPGTVALTIHLDLAQARSLEEVARVDMVSVSEATRNALSHYVANRRQEPGHAARLRQMDAGSGHDRFGR